jgi:hypothetical protein
MSQQGQVFELKTTSSDGSSLWAYRYRDGGRGSRRVQRGGFASERAASEALARALDRLRREQGLVEAPKLSELIDLYLAQHGGEPETVAKLRWLLAKAVRAFGHRRINQLRPAEIATWRMNIAAGHRFEATQALRQVLGRAVSWGLIDVNPAKQGIDNPQRRYTEKRPFESWAELELLAGELGPRYGQLVLFAAATGLRPGEWIALEHRDIDRNARVPHICERARRAPANDRACRARTAANKPGVSARVSVTEGRLLRPAQLPQPSLETSSARSRDQPDAFTISGTPLRPSRFVPASRPSTSRITWERA